jgi:type I restriction enzyme S subunit
MRKGWEVKKLGEVCTVIAGQSPEGRYYNEKGNGLPFYQGKKEFTEKYIGEPTTWTSVTTKEALKGDVLMSVRAPVGPVNFSTQKICIGRGLAAIRAGKAIDGEFLFNFLVKHENEIEGNAGAVFNSINKSQIENIEIPLPPLPEQKLIVTILDETFTAIDKAKFNVEKNLQNSKEIFEIYLENLFNEEKSENKKVMLSEVCEISSKLVDPRKREYENLLHVGGGNIESKTGRLYNLKTAKEENLISGKFLFNNKMILYSKIRPYLMKVVKCDFDGLCSADIYPLLPDSDKISQEYLYYLLFTKNFTEYAIEGSQRAGMPKVNREHLFRYTFSLPSLKEQKRITHILDNLFRKSRELARCYQEKLLLVEELGKTILKKAFTGELTYSTEKITA